jgi:hypothetical protein
MHDAPLTIYYESLGHLLDKLKAHPIVLSSPELDGLLDNALGFYRDLQKEYDHILADNQYLAHEIDQLKSQSTIVVADDTFAELLPYYQRICDAGGDAKLIYRLAVLNAVDEVLRLKLLRSLFGLSLPEAQAIAESVGIVEAPVP